MQLSLTIFKCGIVSHDRGVKIQTKSVTVTPLGHDESVALTNCHCKQRLLNNRPIIWDMPKVLL